nr:hypothetical protein [Mesorhizobium sp.]
MSGHALDEGRDPFRFDELGHVADAVDGFEVEPFDLALHRLAMDADVDDAIGGSEKDAGGHGDLTIALFDAAEIAFDGHDIGGCCLEMGWPQPSQPPPSTM